MLRRCSASLSGVCGSLALSASLLGCVPDPVIEIPDFRLSSTVDSGTPPPTDMGASASWSAGKSGVTAHLRGAWVADAALTTVYLVGHEGTILRGSGTMTFLAEASGSANLYGVAGVSQDEAYAVGDTGTVLHRVAGKWTAEAGDLKVRAALFGVTTLPQGEVYAVGDAGTILHKDQGTWKIEKGPSTTVDLRAVRANGADLLAVGTGGAIWRRSGGTWTADTVQPAEKDRVNYYAIAVLDNTWYIAGEYAVVLKREGDKWAAEPTIKPMPMMGRPVHFYGLYGAQGELFAVGEGGTVQRRVLSMGMPMWSAEKSNTAADLSAITGAGTKEALAVGASGTLVRRQ